jgi:hypothetical protein
VSLQLTSAELFRGDAFGRGHDLYLKVNLGRPSPHKPAGHHIELGGLADEGHHGDGLRLVVPDHADASVWIVTTTQKHPAAVEQRLPRSPADQFARVAEASIKPIVMASAAVIERGLYDDGDVGDHWDERAGGRGGRVDYAERGRELRNSRKSSRNMSVRLPNLRALSLPSLMAL